jgi:asparagine synthase (glutamine-hydrolysing)
MSRPGRATYIGILWTEKVQNERAKAHALRAHLLNRFEGWEVAIDEEGATVLVGGQAANGCHLYPLGDGAGFVLGTLFHRAYEGGAPPKPIVLDAAEIARVITSGGKHLIESFWGSYIAFVGLRAPKSWLVLRDPSGLQQCYFSNLGNIKVFFSRLSDFEELSATRSQVSWAHVGRRLAFGAIPARHTGVRGVSQLMPGEGFIHSARKSEPRIYWDLASIASKHAVEDEAAACNLLFDTTRASVHAWASLYPRILLLLSGGLDSAIVLTCLKDAPGQPEIFGLNNYSSGSDSDERKYARLAAEQAGITLAELERDPTVSWAPVLNLSRSPVPYATIGTVQSFEQVSRIAEATRALAQFSGGGGDVLFYRHAGFLAAADFLRSHPLSKQLGQHLFSAAYRDRTSIWKVFSQAIYYGPLRARFRTLLDPRLARPLLGPAVPGAEDEANLQLHPLIEMLRSAPEGKRYQVICLLYATCIHERPSGLPNPLCEIAPLLSQPLMEAAARIPLYRLTRDGVDRAMARDVFSAQIPLAIKRRQSKGGLEECARQSLMNNLSLVKELLLEGQLVKEKLLDREKLLQVLTMQPHEIPARVAEIYDYVNIEAWVQSFQRT